LRRFITVLCTSDSHSETSDIFPFGGLRPKTLGTDPRCQCECQWSGVVPCPRLIITTNPDPEPTVPRYSIATFVIFLLGRVNFVRWRSLLHSQCCAITCKYQCEYRCSILLSPLCARIPTLTLLYSYFPSFTPLLLPLILPPYSHFFLSLLPFITVLLWPSTAIEVSTLLLNLSSLFHPTIPTVEYLLAPSRPFPRQVNTSACERT
jgi:hypothetical protein